MDRWALSHLVAIHGWLAVKVVAMGQYRSLTVSYFVKLLSKAERNILLSFFFI